MGHTLGVLALVRIAASNAAADFFVGSGDRDRDVIGEMRSNRHRQRDISGRKSESLLVECWNCAGGNQDWSARNRARTSRTGAAATTLALRQECRQGGILLRVVISQAIRRWPGCFWRIRMMGMDNMQSMLGIAGVLIGVLDGSGIRLRFDDRAISCRTCVERSEIVPRLHDGTRDRPRGSVCEQYQCRRQSPRRRREGGVYPRGSNCGSHDTIDRPHGVLDERGPLPTMARSCARIRKGRRKFAS